jgi:L-alanine-DL-glutamate epimerase-like enolase superfamily enzyme
MPKNRKSRRQFLGTAAAAGMGGMPALADPGLSAAQAVGIKPGDFPDLTIKEVKVYVMERGQLASVVTNSGIEGNYTLANRYFHPNWSNLGWLDYAKRRLPGQSVLDLPALTSQWEPVDRRLGQLSYASAIDNCLWDILGKACGLPVYRILGAHRTRVLAYASSQHLNTVDEFVTDVKRCKAEGFKAYKIHPPWVKTKSRVDYKLDMEVAKAVREAGGNDFILLFDRVGAYTRHEALIVGRLLQDLNYVAHEDPIPTTDIDGLADLCHSLDIPVHIGEFIFSIYDFPEYIRRGAVDVVRFIVDNVGGISGGMKLAHLAECFGLECAPHNWGDAFDHAVHFHCELAMPNNVWFEVTQPQTASDRPYIKDRIRIDKDGYVPAPVKPGLGYELDRDALDKLIKRIDR